MTYETRIQVRFGDVDKAGIVYYPVVLHYCHVAFEDFFHDHVGTPYPELIATRHLGFPTVALETSFSSPFEYGMSVVAAVTVLDVGRSSTRWQYHFRDDVTGDELASSVNTTAAVDMRTFQTVAVPDDLRAAFLRDAEDDDPGQR